MYVREYGDPNLPKLLLLHPMCITGENLYESLIPYLKGQYCILAPDQGGHGRSSHYLSLRDEVATLKYYLAGHGYTEFQLLYGASMGVTVALELLKDPDLHFEKIWLDGAGLSQRGLALPGGMTWLLRGGLKVYRKDPERIGRSFVKHYGPEFGRIMKANFLRLGDEDILRVILAFGQGKLVPPLREVQHRMHLEWGSKDKNCKHSQKALLECFPEAEVLVREGYGHCTYMARHTGDYVAQLEQFLNAPQA